MTEFAWEHDGAIYITQDLAKQGTPDETPRRYRMCICEHIFGEHREEGFQGCIMCDCVSFTERPAVTGQKASSESGRQSIVTSGQSESQESDGHR